MPDEDELEVDDSLEALVADELLVETLMGWDGDRCECPHCPCPRFRDAQHERLCASCLTGHHWPVSA